MSNFCSPVKVIARVVLTDHQSVLCTVQKADVRNQCTKVGTRQGKASATRAFGEWLTRFNWTSVYRTKLM